MTEKEQDLVHYVCKTFNIDIDLLYLDYRHPQADIAKGVIYTVLYLSGKNYTEIGELFNKHRTTVQKVIKACKYKEFAELTFDSYLKNERFCQYKAINMMEVKKLLNKGVDLRDVADRLNADPLELSKMMTKIKIKMLPNYKKCTVSKYYY